MVADLDDSGRSPCGGLAQRVVTGQCRGARLLEEEVLAALQHPLPQCGVVDRSRRDDDGLDVVVREQLIVRASLNVELGPDLTRPRGRVDATATSFAPTVESALRA